MTLSRYWHRIRYHHRVTIERPIESQGFGGARVTSWEPLPGFENVPAEVIPDGATEFFGAAQVQNTANAVIRLRWQPGIDGTMRVKHQFRPGLFDFWHVEGTVNFQGVQRELRLMCLKRDAEGFRRGTDLVNA